MDLALMEKQILIMNSRKVYIGYIVLSLLLIFAVILSLITGNYKDLNAGDVFSIIYNSIFGTDLCINETAKAVVLNIRIPRTLSAALVGGCLAASGIAYQSVFDNELASPDVLGVSSGACVGAAAAILAGMNGLVIQACSFISGLCTVFLVFVLSKLFRNGTAASLIISGMLISGLMNSVLGFIKYIADPESELPSIIYWTMGDISSISMKQIAIAFGPMLICFWGLCLFRWRLNFLSLSDSEAMSMGVNIKRLRICTIIFSTVLVGSAISIAGSIGWIGLVIPNLIKTIFGRNTVYTFPLSVLGGAIFLLLIDVIGRIISTSELPLSILTGICGMVIFTLCMVSARGKKNGA